MGDGKFKPGNKMSKGRPPILLPEVQRAIEANRNATRILILDELNALEGGVPRIKKVIESCLERAGNDGDAQKLKILLELALGKMVEDPPDFPVSEDEKLLIIEYRRRKALQVLDGNS